MPRKIYEPFFDLFIERVMNKRFITVIKIVCSLIAIIVLLSFIDFTKAFSIIQNFNLIFVPLVLVFIFLNVILFVFNFWLLLEKKFSFWDVSKDYFVVWAFSLFLPGKIGELGIIPVLKKNYSIPYKFAGLAVLISKFSMAFVFLALFLVFGSGFVSSIEGYEFIVMWILMIIVVIIFIFFVFRKKIISLLLQNKFVYELYTQRVELKKIISLKNSLIVIVLAILRFFTFVMITLLLYVAFGYIPDFGTMIIAIAISQLMVFIPITINGLGAREATFASIMTIAGTPIELSAGVLFISLVLNYSIGIIVIIYWNLIGFISKKRLRK